MVKKASRAQTVTIHEAKTHLSRLLRDVARGQEVIIAKGAAPVARLLPFDHKSPVRTPGLAKGEIWIADDFDAPTDFEKEFYGA